MSENNWSLEDVATVRTVAIRLGVTPQYVYDLIKAGDLKGRQVGGKWLVYIPSVDRWEKERGNR